ncbi:MAG: acetoacetate--CoA ligase [Pseudomonadota bacterium]
MPDSGAGDILWAPSSDTCRDLLLTRFQTTIEAATGHTFKTYEDLHRWSVTEPGQFWSALWDFCSVIGEQSGPPLVEGGDIERARFFPEARLNYAENCLSRRGDAPAILFRTEGLDDHVLSWDDLRGEVSVAQQVLRNAGVVRGDRVAAVTPNVPKAVVYMLATASLGAVWSSCSPDFGAGAILDRFRQIKPKVLLWVDGYTYKAKWFDNSAKMAEIGRGLPSIGASIRLRFPGGPDVALPDMCSDEAALRDGVAQREPEFVRVSFNAPLLIMFSSGTSGPPKCIMHSVGGTLLQHLKEHQLHANVGDGDRLFYFTTCSWMMWNWLVSGLASGATLVLFDGSPFHPDAKALWRMARDFQITHFGTSPKYIETLRKHDVALTGHIDLPALRAVLSTGSPLSAPNFEYVYAAIKRDIQLASISGGTDIVSCFLLGCPALPVRSGELQCAGLGMDVRIYDVDGHEIATGTGDLTCATPFPSRPIGFWGDTDGARYHDAYFSEYPNVWCQHDRVERTASGGYIVHGRSDATLNPGGVRIGSAEIYRALDDLDPISEAVVAGRDIDDDVEVVLFVLMHDRGSLTEDMIRTVKQAIRSRCTPRHVPARVIEVPDIPRTRNGKTSETAVRSVLNNTKVPNLDQLENPDCLASFALANSP